MAKDLFLHCGSKTKEKYLRYPGLERTRLQAPLEERDYLFIDLETTGFSPVHDRIIEIAVIRARGEERLFSFSTLINPEVPVPPQITALTGIDDSMLRDAPTISEYADELVGAIGDCTIVAYSRLEEAYLSELYRSLGYGELNNQYIDTMDLAIMLLPSLSGHRQAELASLWGVEEELVHRATEDTETLFCVYNILLNALYNLPLPIINTVVEHSADRGAGLTQLLESVLQERTGGRRPDPLKVETLVKRDRFWENIAPLEGRGSMVDTGPDEVSAVFRSGGPLSERFSDFEERDEQLEMSEVTRRALNDKEIMLIEAGTGTGKSLAYLVPAILWSMAKDLPVAVSTRTLNLQDQLYTKDLPILETAMGEGAFRYSLLKGYSNYICMRKLQLLVNGRKRLERRQPAILGMLLNWITENETGDLSLMNITHLEGLGEQVVAANHRECPGAKCSFARSGTCFYRNALYRAKRSHVVVINHSLLLAGVNLPLSVAIIDEAHTLEDVATEHFTQELDYRETRRFLWSLFSPLEKTGFLPDIADSVRKSRDDERFRTTLFEIVEAQELVELCIEEMTRLFIALTAFQKGDGAGFSDIRFTDGQIQSLEYTALLERFSDFDEVLDRLQVRLYRVLGGIDLPEDDTDSLRFMAAELEGKAARAVDIQLVLRTVFSGEPDSMVRWATVSGEEMYEKQSLRVTPIDVGQFLKETLYDPLEAIVMTSATLTVGGSFDFFTSRVGLDLLADRFVEKIMLDSSFDYRRQMQIMTVHDMPSPSSEGYAPALVEVLEKVIKAANGGVLALFTNRRLMLDTYEQIVDRLRTEGLPLLCQQAFHSRRRLAEEFVDDPHASLFGTSSFWEGVDARGATLKLVVVTRIPFESPGRPVFEARSERVRLEGGSDFMNLSLPLAALKLKQGVGRLIRTRSDRGQVLLLDSRIVNARYGQVLLRSLPPGRRRNVSLDEVGRAIGEFRG